MAQLPTGTVTMLFTDIEGSTALLTRLGESYGEALLAQRRLLRAAFEAHGGVEMGTEGDSFFIVFAEASWCLEAAVEGQLRLARHAFPGGERVRVRMGIHTGTPRVMGGGYVGLDVHRAARVAGAAHGGQILLSQTTVESLSAGEQEVREGRVRNLGLHLLKDMPAPETLYQVVETGLEADFPPPKSLGGRSSLPRPSSPLIGREEESAALRALLDDQEHGLVTLLGPGGTGKTRIALEVARSTGDDFRGGVYFVGLEAAYDDEAAIDLIGAALGLSPAMRSRPAITSHVGAGPTLLVLDNLEQLEDADRLVHDLLLGAGDAGLRILATSRRVLGVPGERVFAVPPMRDSAVELFEHFAVKANPRFRITEQTRADVEEVCRRLDGLPLAIELVAPQTRLLTPSQLLQRLSRTLDVEGSNLRVSRQRSLRAVTGWSYLLLSTHQRRFFRYLSAFRGGADLDLLTTAFPPDILDGHHPIDVALELADVSLVKVMDGDSGTARITLLETIWEYANEKLLESGENDHAHERHLLAMLAWAEELEKWRESSRSAEATPRFLGEFANVEAALEWGLAGPEGLVDRVAELCRRTWFSWWELGQRGHRWPTAVLKRCSEDSAHYGWLKLILAQQHWAEADDDAELLHEWEALGDLAQSTGDYALMVTVMEWQAELLQGQGRPDECFELIDEAMRIAVEHCSDWLVTRTASQGAAMAILTDRLAEAHDFLDIAEERAGLHNDVYSLRNQERLRVQLLIQEGNLDQARPLLVAQAPEDLSSPEPSRRAHCIILHVTLLAASQPDDAARLVGVHQGIWERAGVVLSVQNWDQFHQWAAPAIEQIGWEAFERHRLEGRSMGAGEAIDWALALLEENSAPMTTHRRPRTPQT